jgi:hypothetical protein
MLTQERLQELLDYNPETGEFTRQVSGGGVKAGSVVGCKNSHGYLLIGIGHCIYPAHRLAFLYMRGTLPEGQVDHINGQRDDNRWVNLRDVTNIENQRNAKRRSNNSSGIMGVSWHKAKRKWQASITIDNCLKHLGYFNDFDEAVTARKRSETEYGFHPNHNRVQQN